jgi:hypothetical protein
MGERTQNTRDKSIQSGEVEVAEELLIILKDFSKIKNKKEKRAKNE